MDGRLGNATYLAVYALFHVFFAVLLFVRERKDAVMLRTAYVAAGAVNLIALYGTATRGAVVGLLGSIVFDGAYPCGIRKRASEAAARRRRGACGARAFGGRVYRRQRCTIHPRKPGAVALCEDLV